MKATKLILPVILVSSMFFPSSLEASMSQKSLTAPPQNRKGGEGAPPLPLPATPLRRTERKRMPKPPMLIREVIYTQEAGEASRTLKLYMQSVNSVLSTDFSTGKVNINQFSFDPAETPILYFTGESAFKFSDENRKKLTEFLTDGGYAIFDAAENSEAFRKSALEELSLMFPGKIIGKLPLDHPIFSCLNDLHEVSYMTPEGIKKSAPELLGLNLGCRAASIVTSKDLDCEWDGVTKENFLRISREDARKLALNISAYMLGEISYGRKWAVKTNFQKKIDRDAISIPRIVYKGEWDAQSGLQELLRQAYTESTFSSDFKEVNLKADSEQIFNYPIVYMSGLSGFKFSESEIQNLRRYFSQGGIMISDATAGRQEFDISFRKLMNQVFPEKSLIVLPESHPVFSCFKEIKSVSYSQMSQAKGLVQSKPVLEAILNENGVSVLYSRYDIGTKWSRNPPAYESGLDESSSMALGLNMLVYCTTH